MGADNVARIEVNTFQQAASLFAGMPDTTSQAQYSLGFALAARLIHGRIGPEHVSGAGLKDAAVADVLPKITIMEDTRHSVRFPMARWSDVTVTHADGRVLSSGDVHARGGPEAPMSLNEVETKFHAMSGRLSEVRKAAIWDMRAQLLHPKTRFGDLLDLLRDPVGVT